MPRPKSLPAPAIDVIPNTEALAAASDAANAISAIDYAVAESAELFKLVGRIEASHFLETVSARLIAECYQRAKGELNRIKHLRVPGPDGKPETVSDIERFCELVMPVSARRCRQIVAAIDTLGTDLYEQAERIGFRARDYQALKALPADDQALVKQALAGEGREQVLDLLTELAARNMALRERAERAQEDLQAKDDLIAAKNQKIDKLLTRRKFQPSADSIAQTAEQQKQLDELHDATRAVDVHLLRLATVMAAMAADLSTPMRRRMQQAVQFLAARLAGVADEHALEVDLTAEFNQRPEWLDAVLPTGDASAANAG